MITFFLVNFILMMTLNCNNYDNDVKDDDDDNNNDADDDDGDDKISKINRNKN